MKKKCGSAQGGWQGVKGESPSQLGFSESRVLLFGGDTLALAAAFWFGCIAHAIYYDRCSF